MYPTLLLTLSLHLILLTVHRMLLINISTPEAPGFWNKALFSSGHYEITKHKHRSELFITFCRYSANKWPSEMYIISLLSLCSFAAGIASFSEFFFFFEHFKKHQVGRKTVMSFVLTLSHPTMSLTVIESNRKVTTFKRENRKTRYSRTGIKSSRSQFSREIWNDEEF